MVKILLAEDDQTMISLLKALLKMEGYRVVALDADADIVATVMEEKPDILLMDVYLFKKNGLEELSRLRATAGGESVRVVMVSGLDFKDQCLKGGADAFLQKPFMPDDLLALLSTFHA